MTFEPFAVQCTTCASRLRVTDPAIVGTIANCPKCDSMVQIQPPHVQSPHVQPQHEGGAIEKQVAVGSPQIDSEAITEEAIAADSSEQVDPATVPSGFGVDESISSDARDYQDETLGGPISPSWQSERTQRSRQIAMIVAIAGAGLIASAIVFGWFVKNWPSKSEPVSAVTQPDVPQPDIADPDGADPDGAHPDGADPDLIEPDAIDPNDGDTHSPAQPADSVTMDADASTDDGPATEPETTADATADPSTDTKMPESAAPVTETAIPSDLLTPAALDPLGLDAAAKDTSFPDDTEKNPAEPDGPKDLSDETRELLGILDLAGGQDSFELEAPPTLDDITLDGPANENIDPMMIANPPEPINFRRALAIKLALAPTKNDTYPLSDLILLMSQVSGVPIQIDWVSFDLMEMNIRDGVPNLKANGWRSVDDLLNRVAESVDGEITRTETLLTLAPTDDAFKEKLDSLLDLSDFGTGQPTAMATVNAFLVGSQQPGANAKTVKVGEERHDQQVAALAVEAMRRVRGIKGKLSDEVVLRWTQSHADKQLAAADTELDWPLIAGGITGEQLLSPLTMAGALRRLSRANDATCFINWLDANRRGMAPQQLVMPYMKPDAGKVLTQLLSPFELQVRRVDDHHWWVGTQATYDRFPVVVWTQPLGKSSDEFANRIKTITGDDETKLAIDPDTGRALVLLPRFIVRQLPKLTKGLN